MGRYVHRHPVYQLVIKELFHYVGDHTPQLHEQLFTYGPLQRFLRILDTVKISRRQTLRAVLFPDAINNVAVFRRLETIEANDWKNLVCQHIQRAFIHWVEEKVRTYPVSYQRPLRVVLDLTSGRKKPLYMTLGGDRARAAFRFQCPFLRRTSIRAAPLPPCNWCKAEQGEQGLHLMQCPARPPSVIRLIAEAMSAISTECRSTNASVLSTAFMRVCWREQTQASILLVLDAMSYTVNEYIRSFPADVRPPIAPIHTIRPRMEMDDEGGDAESEDDDNLHLLMFDGASRGNPGHAGAGAVILDRQRQQIWEGCEYLGAAQTNNEAEYRSLIMGLKAAHNIGIHDLLVHGDSAVVINQMNRHWIVTKPHLLELYREARNLADAFRSIKFKHFRRRYNSIADGLSNQAINLHIRL
jgi:ribonuclease HI